MHVRGELGYVTQRRRLECASAQAVFLGVTSARLWPVQCRLSSVCGLESGAGIEQASPRAGLQGE